MPTIRKATRGAEFLHGYGTVRGGDTIEVDADTAEYLVDQDGYERVVDVDGEEVPGDGDGYLRDKPPGVQIEEGVCPWCDPDDRYEGDGVPQHASSAHSEAWAAYSEGDG
jgi:hypothetical protein